MSSRVWPKKYRWLIHVDKYPWLDLSVGTVSSEIFDQQIYENFLKQKLDFRKVFRQQA